RDSDDKHTPPKVRAWESIKDLFIAGQPEPNTVYYFMSCTRPTAEDHDSREAATRFAIAETGCKHVGLVIGKTAPRKRVFDAVYVDL
ncbi:hypothetical protein LZ31DRAFT_439307, partial [Colletotrichum somersetense]